MPEAASRGEESPTVLVAADPQSGEPLPAHNEPTPTTPGLGRVLVNLLLLCALGVGASLWFYLYTDRFGVVASLLGLGGIFTWIAFLSGLLTKERKEQLQSWIDRVCLQGRLTLPFCLAASLVGTVVWSLSGAIVLRSPADDTDRVVTVERLDPRPPTEPSSSGDEDDRPTPTVHLPPRSVHRQLLWPLWGGNDYKVKVSGFPPVRAHLAPFARRTLDVPGSFNSRPVVVLRLTPRLRANVAKHGMELSAWLRKAGTSSRTGTLIARVPTRDLASGAVWIGCGADCDVDIPEGQLDLWRLDLAKDSQAEIARWAAPVSAGDAALLEPGDRLSIEIRRADRPQDPPYVESTIAVGTLSPGRGFIQSLLLTTTGAQESTGEGATNHAAASSSEAPPGGSRTERTSP